MWRTHNMRRSWWILALLALGLVFSQLSMAAEQTTQPKKLNPHTGDPAAIKAGRTIWLQYGCSGCHGAGGGGGMCPSIIDDQWTFGSDDETLFRLIKGEIPHQTMPTMFGSELTDDQIWQVLAYVRSIYKGDPSKINW
jgi:cytochrome c(L)